MDNKKNVIFEREALGKALLARAERGEWDQALALSDKLGPEAWHRRGLMGESAEEAGFGASWKGMGMPDGAWLRARAAQGEEERFERLQALGERSVEGLAPTPDKARHALAWLAWCAPSQGSKSAFEFMGGAGTGAWGLDVGAWAEAMGARARAGSLGPAWRRSAGLWAMAGCLEGRDAEAFAQAFMAAGLLPTLRAARAGALGVSQSAIGRLDARAALALFAAAVCDGSEWGGFERALGAEPESDLAGQWRSLAAAAAGEGEGSGGFERLGVGSSWTDLARGSLGEESGERWDKAMAALASRAAPALAAPGMEEARAWVVGRAPGWARGLLSPDSADEWDPSGLEADEVSLELSKRLEGKGPGSAADARAAARRLWELSPSLSPGKRGDRPGEPIQAAAMVLWRSSEPLAFLAFAQELSALTGGPGEAAGLCGLPAPEFSNGFEGQLGSPGHAIALALAFPPGCADREGTPVWTRPEWRESGSGIRWLWDRVSMGALMGMLEAGAGNAWSAPLPAALPPMGEWAAIDLGSPKWRGLVEGREAALAWEGAFEAVGALAAAIGADPRSARPPEPSGREGPNDLPTRLAWSRWALEEPRAAAAWVAEKVFGPGDSRLQAERVLGSLSAEAKGALAGALPEAFEKECSSVHRLITRRLDDVAEACRRVGRAAAPSGPGAFAPDEVLCAALMCASAYGLARLSASSDGDRLDMDGLGGMARELAAALPQAASAMMAAGFEPSAGASGFSGADLAGKAAWGSLSFAVGWGAGPSGLMGDKGWARAWEGIELDRENKWTVSCLSALFTPAALNRGRGGDVIGILGEASAWLRGFEADGLGRLPGERSAIERAVYSRFDAAMGTGRRQKEDGCFGAEVAATLVGLGADPSDAGAPGGLDALALCAGLARKASPSSVMKALVKSPKARVGRGALLARLSTGLSGLSETIVRALSEAALAKPELGALARLGLIVGSWRSSKAWIRAALSTSAEARAWASDGLLGEMAAIKAGAGACAAVAAAMNEAGLAPSEADRRSMLERGMASQMRGHDSASFAQWAAAGAGRGSIERSTLDGEMDKACVDAGLGTRVWVADALMARALSMLVDGRSGGPCGSWAMAAHKMDEMGYGSEMLGELAGKLLEKGGLVLAEGALSNAIGEEVYAKIEALALKGASRPAAKAMGPSKRL